MAPFIMPFQWPTASRLQLHDQVGCRVVHNIWGLAIKRVLGLESSNPAFHSLVAGGGELQQWPRSTSPAWQEVSGKEPWEQAAY